MMMTTTMMMVMMIMMVMNLVILTTTMMMTGHILSRIYNCAKPGNWRINHRFDQNLCPSYSTITFLQLHSPRFYNCRNCDQLHTKICSG